MSLSWPYRETPFAPRFGPTTSRANFCEEDFIITGYIGEYINTISNLAYVVFAIYGLRQLPTGHRTLAAQAIYYALACVGIFSAYFHGLLKYHAQMADEAAMILASSACLHRAVTFEMESKAAQRFTMGLIAAICIETTYHCIMDEQTIHELSFVALIAWVGIKTRSLIRKNSMGAEDRVMLRNMSMLGFACFIFGYILWQLDFIYCTELTALKRSWGLPWAFLLEFHGWWHVLTAVGAFIFMFMVDNLTRDASHDVTAPFSNGNPFSWLKQRGTPNGGLNGANGTGVANGNGSVKPKAM